ncbi:MAG: hypothetical protein HDQ87_11580 [Clostridia bacterium]|nr:hypothetical protein [Clostridia bacterium]
MEKGRLWARALAVLTAAVGLAALMGCQATEPEPTSEELMLVIDLDTEDDIGLLVIDYEGEGVEGSGGVSNADKTVLRRGEKLFFTLDKEQEHYDDPDKLENLTVRFSVVDPGIEPNIDNVYPAESVSPLEPVTVPVSFGESAHLAVRGSRPDGYTAELLKAADGQTKAAS